MTHINYCNLLVFSMTLCVERTYINLGRHIGKKRHVTTVPQREVSFKILLYGPEWSLGYRHTSVRGGYPPQQRTGHQYDWPLLSLSSRQSCVTQMHLETQLKATRHTIQCSVLTAEQEERKHACNICQPSCHSLPLCCKLKSQERRTTEQHRYLPVLAMVTIVLPLSLTSGRSHQVSLDRRLP